MWRSLAVFNNFEVFWGVFGFRSGPNGSRQLIEFIWAKFQAKRLTLDPFGTKFDVFGVGPNFGQDLTSPVAANQLAAGAFFAVKMTTNGFDKPCCCYPACRRRFFSVKMTTQDLTSPVVAIQLTAGCLLYTSPSPRDRG